MQSTISILLLQEPDLILTFLVIPNRDVAKLGRVVWPLRAAEFKGRKIKYFKKKKINFMR